jgi:hypothetical protein
VYERGSLGGQTDGIRVYHTVPAKQEPAVSQPPKPRRRGPDWWVYATIFFLLVQVALYAIPHTRPGVAGAFLWVLGGDPVLWMPLAALLVVLGFVRSLLRRPILTGWRVIGAVLLIALAVSPSAFRVYPSSHEGKPSQVRFRLPMDGPITVAWGGDNPDLNYHVAYPDQRWASDLWVMKDGQTHRRDGKELTDYYCYALPVLAPADGTIVFTRDIDPDMPTGELGGGTDAGGNQVVIEVAPNEYLFLCHLQPKSVLVKVGDRVTAGQPVARVGNSGNTSEPHLHIHLQDAPPPDLAEGIPLYFHNYRADGLYVDRGMPYGGHDGERWTGQVVEHAGPPKP